MTLSLRHLLVGLFALLATITGVQGAFIVEGLFEIQRDVSAVSQRIPAINAVQEVARSVARFERLQSSAALSTYDPSVIRNDLIEIEDARKEVAATNARWASLLVTPQDGERHAAFLAAWNAYDRISAAVEKPMQAGRMEEARQALLSPWLRVLARTIDAQLGRSVAVSTAAVDAATAAATTRLGQARRASLIFVILSAMLACAAAFLLCIRVLRPYVAVNRAMRRMADGDTGPPVPGQQAAAGNLAPMLEAFRASLIRTRAAEAARRSALLFVEKVAATTPDGIVGIDAGGTVTFWNEAAARLAGFSAGEMIGHPLTSLFPSASQGGSARTLETWQSCAGQTVESRIRHRAGHVIPIELSSGSWREGSDDFFCLILRDIRTRKANEDVLHRLAHRDVLTELPNRAVLTQRLAETLAAKRPAALLMADLDGFKQVNDVLGHAVGDQVLRIAASRLAACAGPEDTPARIGGDEFVLLLAGHADPLRAAATADALIRSLSEPFTVEDRTLHLSASVGVALAPTHGETATDLLSCADMALYAVKGEGRCGHRLFTPDLRHQTVAENRTRQELRRAVEHGEFELFFQPQVRLSDQALMGAEALLRWRHPERGLLAPEAFLAVLEGSRHAAEVGAWVIAAACRQAAAWRAAGAPAFRMGVNLSGAQFRFGDLAAVVRTGLEEAGLPAAALELEITETIVLGQDEAQLRQLQALRDIGVGLAFDDFGTGYASLSMLKRFPLTRLKIDRSFVRDLNASPTDAAIMRALLLLGQSLGLQVIAEGIETEDQASWLCHKNCAEAQGYLFGRPMPADDFARQFHLAPAATPAHAA